MLACVLYYVCVSAVMLSVVGDGRREGRKKWKKNYEEGMRTGGWGRELGECFPCAICSGRKGG